MTLNANGVECRVADPCGHCAAGYPHRAKLMAYDPASGEYIPKESYYCVARWDRRSDGHAADDICGAPATEKVAGIDLCSRHFDRLSAWGYWVLPQREHEAKRRALRESAKTLRREIAAAEAEAERIREAERARYSVVYFIRRTSDGMIKIGTTAAFDNRMQALRGEFGEIQVLWTQSGGRPLERKMHDQFAVYRIEGSEWFRPTRTLLEWIHHQRKYSPSRDSQKPGAVAVSVLRGLEKAALRDCDLQWKAGRLIWPESDVTQPRHPPAL